MDETSRHSLTRFEHFSSALLDEVDARSADEAVHSALWSTVGAVAGHVTAVYGWVTTILRTGAPAERAESPLDDDTMTTVLRDARDELLAELERDDRECWVIGGGAGTTAFWRRRMVLETLKHLLDVRTPPSSRFAVPTELDAELAADGVDEFLQVFLARSRSSLDPLPGTVRLAATDVDRTWTLAPDWSLDDDTDVTATIEGSAAVLLLLLWERASALDEPDRFRITGDAAIVRALESTPIHR
ncbi:MAG: maleylpyruvate isomerase N-terminal domain-containing protein [Actinobacteria bacterium]|nr:maleylpyruvate isomerase N-terminal domain-containing protein [Actinomycetota bacterium]MBU1610042.1 maleylpyruvate isomerase N-terminal domain-containing protein [Actinomycetota bacterium]MBU2315590.1 maleylpyruvate isomerase N-terminal domain-containing protein [Actinomycetota bacterium]MBU2384517.1 maleylpyruvate isomerase N-terminal domain-containing protein [Actinomycetota bacterium]